MKNYLKGMTRCDLMFIVLLVSIIGYYGFKKEEDCGCGR
jgi:hypothetical protein